MGKKGRRTRWRTLNIAGGADGQHSGAQPPTNSGSDTDDGGESNSSESVVAIMQHPYHQNRRPHHRSPANNYRNGHHVINGGTPGVLTNGGGCRLNGTTSGKHVVNTTTNGGAVPERNGVIARVESGRRSGTASSSSSSSTISNGTYTESTIKTEADEYTRITTPRQDVLFKKGYLNKPKTNVQTQQQVSNSESGSTTNGSPEHIVPTDLDYEVVAPPSQFIYPNAFVDQHGIYYINSFEPYPMMLYNAPPPPPPAFYSDMQHCVNDAKLNTSPIRNGGTVPGAGVTTPTQKPIVDNQETSSTVEQLNGNGSTIPDNSDSETASTAVTPPSTPTTTNTTTTIVNGTVTASTDVSSAPIITPLPAAPHAMMNGNSGHGTAVPVDVMGAVHHPMLAAIGPGAGAPMPPPPPPVLAPPIYNVMYPGMTAYFTCAPQPHMEPAAMLMPIPQECEDFITVEANYEESHVDSVLPAKTEERRKSSTPKGEENDETEEVDDDPVSSDSSVLSSLSPISSDHEHIAPPTIKYHLKADAKEFVPRYLQTNTQTALPTSSTSPPPFVATPVPPPSVSALPPPPPPPSTVTTKANVDNAKNGKNEANVTKVLTPTRPDSGRLHKPTNPNNRPNTYASFSKQPAPPPVLPPPRKYPTTDTPASLITKKPTVVGNNRTHATTIVSKEKPKQSTVNSTGTNAAVNQWISVSSRKKRKNQLQVVLAPNKESTTTPTVIETPSDDHLFESYEANNLVDVVVPNASPEESAQQDDVEIQPKTIPMETVTCLPEATVTTTEQDITDIVSEQISPPVEEVKPEQKEEPVVPQPVSTKTSNSSTKPKNRNKGKSSNSKKVSTANLTANNPYDAFPFSDPTVDISAELDKIIQRGIYNNLEPNLRRTAASDTMLDQDLFKSIISKISTSTITASSPMIGTKGDMAGLRSGKSPSTGALLRRDQITLPKIPTLCHLSVPSSQRLPTATMSTTEPIPSTSGCSSSSVQVEQQPVIPASPLYPITEAVKEWMTKTRETTPDVELLKSPSVILKEFKCALAADKVDHATSTAESTVVKQIDEEEEHSDEANKPNGCVIMCENNDISSSSVYHHENGGEELEVYQSKYGTNEDYIKLQAEVESAIRLQRSSSNLSKNSLPYRAICCSVM